MTFTSNHRSLWASRPSAAYVRNRRHFRFMVPPFLLGVAAAQHVNVVGELYLGELLGALLLLPMFLGRTRLLQNERRLLFFAILWSGAQATSDVYNQTALIDSLKGVFAPLFFVATILGLGAYFRTNLSRMPAFLLGAALGALMSFALFPNQYLLDNSWKFGVAGAVLTLFAVHYSFFLRAKSPVWLFVALTSFIVGSLYFDARGMAVLPFLAGLAYTGFGTRRGMKLIEYFNRPRKFAGLVAVLLIVVFLLNAGATAFFTSELLQSRISPAAAQRYAAQAEGRFGILVGGRPELLVSWQAFIEKPLLGHGSWPKDEVGYRQVYGQRSLALGYSEPKRTIMQSPFIPTHSFLMQALVWSGILGGLFWMVALYGVLRDFLGNMTQLPFYFYTGMTGFLWALLFSPFGGSSRLNTAVFLAAFIAYVHRNRAVSVHA